MRHFDDRNRSSIVLGCLLVLAACRGDAIDEDRRVLRAILADGAVADESRISPKRRR